MNQRQKETLLRNFEVGIILELVEGIRLAEVIYWDKDAEW